MRRIQLTADSLKQLERELNQELVLFAEAALVSNIPLELVTAHDCATVIIQGQRAVQARRTGPMLSGEWQSSSETIKLPGGGLLNLDGSTHRH
ncbi:hypothetical protein NVS55_40240 (plasmid) [Myxococcus stipitatus]|uniref:hypothetical protein n=1 Tax=Myxococcus stipitatus TaxID=83455 RepID=UPI0031455978